MRALLPTSGGFKIESAAQTENREIELPGRIETPDPIAASKRVVAS